MLVSWCQITPENERKTQTGDGDSIQQESLSGKSTQTGEEAKLSPAQILSWKEAKLTLAEVQAQAGDDTPIVVITEANSGAIVTQTGDSLIYRNEVYGFQVLLWSEWVDGQIGIGVQKQHVTVYFTLPDDGIWSFNWPLATMNPRAYTIFRLFIKSKSEYEKYSDRSYYDFIGCNNKYCFLGGKDPGMNNYYTKRYSKIKRESWDFVDSVYQAIWTFSIQE